MNKPSPLIENVDYTINDDGNLVFTSSYLLKRGHCCQSGCQNCPYGYSDKVDPNVPAEFRDVWDEFDSTQDIYDEEDDED